MIPPTRRKADRAYLDTNLWVPKSAVNVEGTKSALTFTYYEGMKRNERSLFLYKETEHHIQVPREFWRPEDFAFDVVDLRPQRYRAVDIRSRIKLDHGFVNKKLVPTGQRYQRDALEALRAARGGILQLACGKGKTIIALEMMATMKVPTIIIVDNAQLLYQWQEEIAKHLIIPEGVGLIRGDVFDWEHPVVLATYHTLAARADVMDDAIRRYFGMAVYEEAHHVNAPTFSRTADLFYGLRYGLTATPRRDDGLHIIHQMHLGPILYRDLLQKLKPKIYFHYTGMTPDMSDPKVVAATHASNGELNIGKIASYFGQWQPRLDFAVQHIRKRVAEGRKVLVLALSVDELVNMLATWNNEPQLYTDVPVPTPKDVGETEQPCRLEDPQQLESKLAWVDSELATAKGMKRTELLALKATCERELKRHEVATKIDRLYNKRLTEYRERLLAQASTAGLMIHKVPSAQRMAMLRSKQVTFAIMKYGKEGLDEASIDTVVVCEPMSSKEVLQQVMGRALREREGKKEPVIDVFEDNVGPMIGMCKKMRAHLRKWPLDEGGPFAYEFVGYPDRMRKLR